MDQQLSGRAEHRGGSGTHHDHLPFGRDALEEPVDHGTLVMVDGLSGRRCGVDDGREEGPYVAGPVAVLGAERGSRALRIALLAIVAVALERVTGRPRVAEPEPGMAEPEQRRGVDPAREQDADSTGLGG